MRIFTCTWAALLVAVSFVSAQPPMVMQAEADRVAAVAKVKPSVVAVFARGGQGGGTGVLINDEGQHSLWPAFKEVPLGWTIAHKSDTRAACLEFIERNWTDMRPNSLIERMEKQADGKKPN